MKAYITPLTILVACLVNSCYLGPDPGKAFVKYYGGGNDETGRKVVATPDGGYLIVGGTTSHASGEDMDVWVLKVSGEGEELWSRYYGTDSLHEEAFDVAIRESSAGDSITYIICGTAIDQAGNADAYLLHIFDIKEDGQENKNDNILWESRITQSSDSYETGKALTIAADGDIVFGGAIRSQSLSNQEFDTYLYKLQIDNGRDHPDWDRFRIWGFPEMDTLTQITSLSDGGLLVLGHTQHEVHDQAGSNMLVYRTNSFGVPLDANTLGTNEDDYPGGLFDQADQTITVIGSTVENGQQGLFLERIDLRLNRKIDHHIPISLGITEATEGISVAALNSGLGYVVAGNLITGDEQNVFVATLDANRTLTQGPFFLGHLGSAEMGNIIETEDGFVFCATFSFGSSKMTGLVKLTPSLSLIP